MAQAVAAFMVVSAIREGNIKSSAKKFEAQQLEQKAIATKAKGTREAIEERRQGRVLISNMRAAMAGTGGTTTDPAAIEQLAKAKQITDYNALTALFESEEESKSYISAAKQRRKEGKDAKVTAAMKSISTVISFGGFGGGSTFGGKK